MISKKGDSYDKPQKEKILVALFLTLVYLLFVLASMLYSVTAFWELLEGPAEIDFLLLCYNMVWLICGMILITIIGKRWWLLILFIPTILLSWVTSGSIQLLQNYSSFSDFSTRAGDVATMLFGFVLSILFQLILGLEMIFGFIQKAVKRAIQTSFARIIKLRLASRPRK